MQYITNTRRLAARIIDSFENLLSRNDIKIPDDTREGEEYEACIYGSSYFELEDQIVDILLNSGVIIEPIEFSNELIQ